MVIQSVAEGLKKTRPNGKIKPIKYGSKSNSLQIGRKKDKPAKIEAKKSKFDWIKKIKPYLKNLNLKKKRVKINN